MWEEGDWNTVSVKSSVTFPVGVAHAADRPGRAGQRVQRLDRRPEQPHQVPEAGLAASSNGSARRSGRPSWSRVATSGPPSAALDPLFLQYWNKQGIDMSAFLTEAHGKVVNFPVSPGVGDALTEVVNDLGPAWLGTESVSSALKTAQADADYILVELTSRRDRRPSDRR